MLVTGIIPFIKNCCIFLILMVAENISYESHHQETDRF